MISVNDKWEVQWQPGMTLRDLLEAVGFTHKVVVISVNGLLIPPADFETHAVADGDLVKVIHIIGGG